MEVPKGRNWFFPGISQILNLVFSFSTVLEVKFEASAETSIFLKTTLFCLGKLVFPLTFLAFYMLQKERVSKLPLGIPSHPEMSSLEQNQSNSLNLLYLCPPPSFDL